MSGDNFPSLTGEAEVDSGYQATSVPIPRYTSVLTASVGKGKHKSPGSNWCNRLYPPARMNIMYMNIVALDGLASEDELGTYLHKRESRRWRGAEVALLRFLFSCSPNWPLSFPSTHP